MLVGLAAIDFILGALWWGWTQIPLYFRHTIHRAAYVKGDGVAVQTTVERLRKVAPSWVRIVPVRYVDHDTVSISLEHSLDKFCLKGVEFRAERELRLLIEKFPAGHPGGGLRIEPHGHRLVEVDLAGC